MQLRMLLVGLFLQSEVNSCSIEVIVGVTAQRPFIGHHHITLNYFLLWPFLWLLRIPVPSQSRSSLICHVYQPRNTNPSSANFLILQTLQGQPKLWNVTLSVWRWTQEHLETALACLHEYHLAINPKKIFWLNTFWKHCMTRLHLTPLCSFLSLLGWFKNLTSTWFTTRHSFSVHWQGMSLQLVLPSKVL